MGKLKFSNRVVTDWNNLPSAVVEATGVNDFKSKLDRYLRHVRRLRYAAVLFPLSGRQRAAAAEIVTATSVTRVVSFTPGADDAFTCRFMRIAGAWRTQWTR